MKDKTKKNDESPSSSRFFAFWSTLPGLLTAIAALITAIGGLYLASLPLRNSKSNASPTPTVYPSPSPNGSSAQSSDDCFDQFFAGIPEDRISWTMEVGTRQQPVVKANQPKEPVIGIKFTDYKRPIGAVRLSYFRSNEIFKIESLVDGKCQPISSDKNVLGMLEPLIIRLNSHEYALTLDYKAGEVRATFQLESP